MTPQFTKNVLNSSSGLLIQQNYPKYWECIASQNAKFPFANISNHEIQCLTFNYNFTHKCQTTVLDLVGDHLTLNFISINSKDRLEYSTVETNDEYFEDLSIQPYFNYYQAHAFHKLAMKLDKRNSFSALHTNIWSLSANLEDLKLLLTNLDHTFDIIGVSETWTSENNNNKNTINNHTIPGYQKLCGTKGSSLKSGCRLFVKEDLNFKERIDLSVKFINDQNEFQSCWIEIINDKKRPNILIGVYY